ncbi:MAG: DUF1330 domain-containing protein [Pseudomonadota bacterium]
MHRRKKTKAYILANIQIHDADVFKAYVEKVPALIAKHQGRYLVRGGESANREGTFQPERMILLEFPDKAAAEAFLDDPEYAPVAALRHQSAHSDLIVMEGVKP